MRQISQQRSTYLASFYIQGVPQIPSNYSSQMELKSSDVNKILGEIKIDRNLVTLSTVLSKGT